MSLRDASAACAPRSPGANCAGRAPTTHNTNKNAQTENEQHAQNQLLIAHLRRSARVGSQPAVSASHLAACKGRSQMTQLPAPLPTQKEALTLQQNITTHTVQRADTAAAEWVRSAETILWCCVRADGHQTHVISSETDRQLLDSHLHLIADEVQCLLIEERLDAAPLLLLSGQNRMRRGGVVVLLRRIQS